MQEEIYAKLVTVERLLTILLSDRRYAELLEGMRADVHAEFGEPLNKMFPSDPAYGALAEVISNFNAVADQIAINHRFEVLK